MLVLVCLAYDRNDGVLNGVKCYPKPGTCQFLNVSVSFKQLLFLISLFLIRCLLFVIAAQ